MNMYEEIEDILDNFDFEKVKKVMDALDWNYWDSVDSHITIAELRKTARRLLKKAYEAPASDQWFVSSGGFEVVRLMYPGDTKNYFYLKFVVAEGDNAD